VRSVLQMAEKIAEVKILVTVLVCPGSLELTHSLTPLVAIANYSQVGH
jgi:hypothetical protein